MMHDIASFLRWRLKPNRWAAKGLYALVALPQQLSTSPAPIARNPLLDALESDGFLKFDRTIAIPEIDLAAHAGSAEGKPFIDISASHPEAVNAAFTGLLGDPETAAMVNAYFGGRPWLWNVGLNYSDPMKGTTDSQLWHFDYGDTQQLHLMVYFADVGEDSGPFTFLAASESQKVKRHPLVIERLTDDDLRSGPGIEPASATIRLTGKSGDIFACDPGRLLHQGARCLTPRLVLFVTFTSHAPMSMGGRAVIDREQRRQFGEAFRHACPDSALPASAFR